MISMKYKLLVQLFALLCTASLALTLVFPVYATDSVDSLEQSSSNLEEELSGLKKELEALSLEIASISEQMAEITNEIKQTKEELAIAKGQEEIQYDTMKQRIRYMYENGNSSLLEILFSSSSMADFLKRAEFVSVITEYDHAQLEKLAETKATIEQKELVLSAQQENLSALQDDLNKKEATLTEKISTASSELTTVTKQLEKAREEAKKAEEALKQEVIPIPPKEETVTPPKEELPPPTSEDASGNDSNDTPSSDSNDNSSDKPTTDSNNSNDSNSDSDDSNLSASASDLELFAALIECEAGSRDYEGMLAVASVVVNRMNHSRYPDTIRGVIYQAGQFPPAHDGKVERVLKRGIKDSCLQAAKDALAGKNNVGDCLSFRSVNSGHVGIVIGDNVFF